MAGGILAEVNLVGVPPANVGGRCLHTSWQSQLGRLAHPQSRLQLFRKGVVHFPNFYKEGGGADGKFPLGESPAVRAVSAGRFGVPAVHSAHKSVLTARLTP